MSFLAPDSPWRHRAACADMPTEMFYLDGVGGRNQENRPDPLEPAKAVCRRCPVIEPCLEQALINDEFGIWGGTTVYERDVIRRRRGMPRRSVA